MGEVVPCEIPELGPVTDKGSTVALINASHLFDTGGDPSHVVRDEYDDDEEVRADVVQTLLVAGP